MIKSREISDKKNISKTCGNLMCEQLNENFIFINMKNKPRTPITISFGKRLASIRRAKGITQEELAKKVGTTQRVIAYYEGETDHIPTNLFVPIAKTLKISLDELVGLRKEHIQSTQHAALWRKLKKVEQLPPKDKKMLLALLESLLSKTKIS